MKKKKKAYLLSLDLSLSNSGYTVFEFNAEKSDAKPVVVGSINTKKIKARSSKLKFIADEIIKIKNKYNLVDVIIEDGFYRFKVPTLALFSVIGVVQYVLDGIPQKLYKPNSIKLTVGGRGEATKKEVLDGVLTYFNWLEFDNFDQSDSTAVGIKHLVETGILK